MQRIRRALAVSIALHLAAAAAVAQAPSLSPLFGDGMVVQRDTECPIWGTAERGATVEVFVNGKAVTRGQADEAGRFRVVLPAMAAPGPYEIELKAGESSIALRDVLVGDVWLCSGQSNMEWPLKLTENADAAIAEATVSGVRLFQLKRISSTTPATQPVAQWTTCTPETARDFSAVAYYFGRHLNREAGVPIGLIHSSWGGTPAESWTPLATLRTLGDLAAVQRVVARADEAIDPEAWPKFDARMAEWMRETGNDDASIAPAAATWSEADFDDSSWEVITLPGTYSTAKVPVGSTSWVRRTFDVPESAAGKPLTVLLGRIDDFDETYVNGVLIGKTGIERRNWFSAPRSYVVPGEHVRAGQNVIAVRVRDLDGRTGFTSEPDKLRVTSDALEEPIPLNGQWRRAIERSGPSKPGQAIPPRPEQPLPTDSSQFPGNLYNAMIAPLGDVGLRGVIWYQGESNANRPAEYVPLMRAMIDAWRDQFRKPELPFYIVGLANFRKPTDDPNAVTDFAPIRQAQRELDRTGDHVATTVTIDVGDANDIHPRDKRSVGDRLALVARAETYGHSLVSRGPTLRSATRQGGEIALAFDHVGGGLNWRGDATRSFAIAGADGKFAWATARLDGERVIVSSPSVPTPTVVRYAFADNPVACLFNAEGLPAEPFEERVASE